jgi:hypothetical protein
MDQTPGSPRPRLRVVRPRQQIERAALQEALLACILTRPDGLAPSRLMPDLAAALGVAVDELDECEIDAALGVLVVTGRVDEQHGLLIPDAQSRRATG